MESVLESHGPRESVELSKVQIRLETTELQRMKRKSIPVSWTQADRWYRNLDKLIHYVNLNGTVNAFYSTPSIYTDWKRRASDKVVYEVRTDDIMPLADNAHNYWSGYFTSRPALKRQVRFATNLLHAARLLELATNTSAAEIDQPSSEKRSPPVGDSWTDSLEGTVGVATHHDGMSGTLSGASCGACCHVFARACRLECTSEDDLERVF